MRVNTMKRATEEMSGKNTSTRDAGRRQWVQPHYTELDTPPEVTAYCARS